MAKKSLADSLPRRAFKSGVDHAAAHVALMLFLDAVPLDRRPIAKKPARDTQAAASYARARKCEKYRRQCLPAATRAI